MSDGDDNRLSTSALAKRLKLPIQQLFVTLRDYGWIDRRDKGWALTAKGELQGGAYQDSQRFGRYIVWPESLMEHPMITAIESNQRITPGGMQRYYPHLGVRQINRNFAELGLLRLTRRGLELSNLGERFGGRQERDEDNGLLIISWPHEIVDNAVIHRELNRLASDGMVLTETDTSGVPGEAGQTGVDAVAPDLFTETEKPKATPQTVSAQRCGLDGHAVDSVLQLRVCDWLYEAQYAHARNRRLPVEESLTADFYVPALGLYIECWERDVPTQTLTRRLRTREVCRELDLAYLEIAAADIERIDDLLTRRVAELSS
ncbi:hypothetical protein [Congregibacter litoralis]|uniref:Uncharacterized protein n=1 Tax=Congregibacter litoralis KT71 TaxID=314285 RepID=A4A8C6_9GAMM|nr:hypothetical protein [Congregibacter litoralis]EAQ97921.1 hypothetical protein KT71_15189 [Congregibacter litoralis KT71]